MKMVKREKEAPIISNITYYHNVKREDGSIGDYIIVNFIGDYNTQVINVETKVDVNSLDKKIKFKGISKSETITLYDIQEQGGKVNEK